jgi:hypothetical protein
MQDLTQETDSKKRNQRGFLHLANAFSLTPLVQLLFPN